jgi:predicted RNA methylase
VSRLRLLKCCRGSRFIKLAPSPIWCNVVNLSLFDENQQGAEGQPSGRGERSAGAGIEPLPGAVHRAEMTAPHEIVIMSSKTEVKAVDQVRLEANRHLNPTRKAELGQFMTPTSVARFMASLFSKKDEAARLLDAGAGVGSLTDAFISRWGSSGLAVSAYEIDETLAVYLRERLRSYGNGSLDATVIDRDFIQVAVYRIKRASKGAGFTDAILNPPYKKIHSDSAHRALLRAVGARNGQPLHRVRRFGRSADGGRRGDRSDYSAELLQRALLQAVP